MVLSKPDLPVLYDKPGKAQSWSWKHVGFLKGKDGKLDMTKAICKDCRTSIAYSNGSTGAIINHLKAIHGLSDPKLASTEATPKLSSFFEAAKPRVCTSARKDAIDQALVIFKILDLVPFDTFEGEGFRQWMHLLEPGYTVPCAKTMTTRHKALFDSEQEALKVDIMKARPGSVAVTRDGWTGVNNRNYDCLTAHDITRDWTLRSQAVAIRETTGKKADDIMGSIKAITSEFGIVKPHITSDNCNTEAAGVRQSGNERIQCQAHIGNLAVQAGIKQTAVTTVLNKVRKVSKWFKRSSGGSKSCMLSRLSYYPRSYMASLSRKTRKIVGTPLS